MHAFENLKQQFLRPSDEFTPIPFWFWNDKLSREEILRQIQDFHAKEVSGFVLHPRMGLPREMPYLSDPFMEMIEVALSEAEKLGMKVILYDEGMYPSGSACGMVVKENGAYASRGLELREYPCQNQFVRLPISLQQGESLVSIQAVRKLSEHQIEAGSAVVLFCESGVVEFAPPKQGDWSVLAFVDTPSRGTIRGVHPGQDDGEPDAPLAADLLNLDAVQSFMRLTHERYYEKFSDYFGTTIIAMFTDEPDLLGRGHVPGLKPWTRSFLSDYVADGGDERDLQALWLDAGEETGAIRSRFAGAIRRRLNQTYYKPLADWCEGHGIGLTGHPAGSDDIGLLSHFHIPGQDIVWRYIAPEENKALTGVHSTMGKCSSDSARHRNKQRNANECFGVCGVEGGWSLSADNMKWYLDWLFVRGVNLIIPHAFYYSIRGERRDERPPDVGPNNSWWPEYAKFSRYMKRLSWLMTDSLNSAKVAVLVGDSFLPWRIVKPLYESQIEFNYLEEQLLNDCCEISNGTIQIAGYCYEAILIERGYQLARSSWQRLKKFVEEGGCIIELTAKDVNSPDIGQWQVGQETEVPALLTGMLGTDYEIKPASSSIRISRIEKQGRLFYVIVNEGETAFQGKLRMNQGGLIEYWRPWTGACDAAIGEQAADHLAVPISVERRECLIVAVDPSRPQQQGRKQPVRKQKAILDLSQGWRVIEGPWKGELAALSSWTNWEGLSNFSGTVVYETTFEIEEPFQILLWRLDLGNVYEIARLSVNGKEAGVQFWKPYVFEIGQYLRPGTNVLHVSVTNSLANRYDRKSLLSGLVGPIRLYGFRVDGMERKDRSN